MSASTLYEESSVEEISEETARGQWSVPTGGENVLKQLTEAVTCFNQDVGCLSRSLFNVCMIVKELEEKGMKEEARAIRQELTKVHNKLAAISSQQRELHETSETTQTRLKSLEDKLLAIDEKLAAISSQHHELHETSETTQTRLKSLEDKLLAIDEKLAAISSQHRELHETSETTQTRSKSLEDKLLAIEEKLADTTSAQDSQREATEDLRKEIGRIEAAQLKKSTADDENSFDEFLAELKQFLRKFIGDTSTKEPITPINKKIFSDSGVPFSPLSLSRDKSFGAQASSTPIQLTTPNATSDDKCFARSLLRFITSKNFEKIEKIVNFEG